MKQPTDDAAANGRMAGGRTMPALRRALPAAVGGVAALAALALVGLGGCADNTSAPPATAAQVSEQVQDERPLADRQTWQVYTIQGERAGYGHTMIRKVTEDGRKVLRIEDEQHLSIVRFDEPTRQTMRSVSVETPEGELIRFESEIDQGGEVQRTTGRVEGRTLRLETRAGEKLASRSVAWTPETRGFYGAEESLLRRPMQPGQKRSLRALMAPMNEVAEIELSAKQYERVRIRGQEHELLRIESLTRFADGSSLPAVLWCDRSGDVLCTRIEAMGIGAFRVPREVALETTKPAEFDLGWDIAVKLDRPIERPDETTKVRYRVELPGDDPAELLAVGDSQRVERLGPHSAEVTVYALRPGQKGGNPDAPADPPTAADREPNDFIQSDDPAIVAMARQAAGEEQDPARVAIKLEKQVQEHITEKGFAKAFASAADVARTRAGDCTEHAVLLAALCRASGIPARVAIGLVYMEGSQSFAYHMWTDAYLGKRWVPLDATRAKGGTSAAYLKLADSPLAGGSAYTSFLPVLRVAGRLKIEVLESE